MDSRIAICLARLRLTAPVLLVLMLLAGAGRAASPDQTPPPAPGMARAWFLQQLLPGTATYGPMIYANGANVGIVPQGTTFYHDFQPGQYQFTVENCPSQQQPPLAVTLHPNTQIAIEVTSDENGPGYYCMPPSIFHLQPIKPENAGYMFSQVESLGAK